MADAKSTFQFTVNPAQAVEFITEALFAGLVPMMTSSPGCGKSQIGKKIAKNLNLQMIDVRLSQMDSVDLNGLPHFTSDGKAEFVPFDTFPTESTPLPEGKDGWLIFLDELNSASRNVIAAAYRVILDKEVGQHKLHPNVAIICAGNLASDKAIVNNMGTAMQSRLVHLVLETNFNGWLEEVAIPQNYDSRIIAYLAQYPNKLMDFNPDHKELTYCCPRSWEFMHRLITGKEVSTNKLALYAGTITSGVAVEFVTFCKLFDNLITIWQILADPDTCTIPSDSSLRWATLTSILSNVTLSNFDTVATYADRFTMDFRVFFYRAALAKSPELKAEPAFVKRLLAISKYLD